ncbi:MAG: hypothetical protein FWF88_06515 [Peptococcaceae bacterium]|jgi:predicted transcriptional regulator|nr:hypothetical protein [Peptococcaceae bacterium]
MSIKLGKRIEIDESNFQSLETLKAINENNTVSLSNDSEDTETDVNALYDHLRALEGADKVKSLDISWSSNLRLEGVA